MIIKLHIQAIKYLFVCVCDRLNTNNSSYFKNKIEITKIHNLHSFFFCQHKTKEYPMRHMHFNCSWQTCNKWPLWATFERNIDWIHYLYHTLSVVSKKRFCSKGRQIILLREKWIKIRDLTKDISDSIYIHLFQSLNSFIKWICKCSFIFRSASKKWTMYSFDIKTNYANSNILFFNVFYAFFIHYIN